MDQNTCLGNRWTDFFSSKFVESSKPVAVIPKLCSIMVIFQTDPYGFSMGQIAYS